MRSLPFVAVTFGVMAIAISSAGAATHPAPHLPAPAASATPKPSKNAPGDRYFGRFHWSVLQLRYEIQFLKKQIGYRTVAPGDALHDARIMEDTLFAWAEEFPRDSWLPQTTYGLEQVMETIPLPEAHDRATHLLQRIVARYDNTPYGKQSQLALDNGIPEAAGYDVVTPPPTPVAASPSPSPSGDDSPAAVTSPGISASSAAPAQTPEASPLATTTPPPTSAGTPGVR